MAFLARKSLCLLPALLAPVFAQTDSAVTREGSYWVQTLKASLPMQPSGRLQVTSQGNITVRGREGEGISYTLKKRVRAVGPEEARRRLAEIGITTSTEGDLTHLIVRAPGRGNTGPDLDLAVPRRLQECILETQGGNVEAYDLDAEVEARTGGGRVQMDRIGRGVSARSGGGGIVLGKVNGEVRSTTGGGSIRVEEAAGEVSAQTGGGEIYVGRAGKTVRAATQGGNIQVAYAGGPVQAQTAGGMIDIGHAAGLVTAQTAGGSIQVGRAQGVRCDSAAGTIRLKGSAGALRVTTAVGNILAELLPGSRLEESVLHTNSGDVTVVIPSNFAVTVRARNETAGARGKIISEFPEIQLRNADLQRLRPALAEGALNGGGPLLQISVSGGTIYLRRQK